VQEKISKDLSENSSEDSSVPDFSRLANAIKIWGKELGFQQVRIADANADTAPS
jgi:epoxyqueuosine reductase